MRDAVSDGAAGVLSDVPVFDADGFAGAVGAMVRIGGDVADGEDVGFVEDLEAFVDAEGAILFKGDGWVVFQVGGFGGDANAEDDEVGGEGGAVFELDGADFGGG